MSTQPIHYEMLRFTLGDRIRKALHASDMKAQDLAEKMGVKRLTVSRWVNDAVEPSLAKVRQIAMITGVPAEWLLTGQLNETPPPAGEGERVEPPTGFEPVTFSLQGDRYRPLSLVA